MRHTTQRRYEYMRHGFQTGRLVIADGQVRQARAVIPASEAVAAFGRPKPVAGGWLGRPKETQTPRRST